MRSPKSLHNLQHDEGGNYMAETNEYDGNIFVAWVLQVRWAEIVTK